MLTQDKLIYWTAPYEPFGNSQEKEKERKKESQQLSEWSIPRQPQLRPPFQESQLKKQNNRLNT